MAEPRIGRALAESKQTDSSKTYLHSNWGIPRKLRKDWDKFDLPEIRWRKYRSEFHDFQADKDSRQRSPD